MFSSITRQLKRARSAVRSVLAIAGTAADTVEGRLKPFLLEGEVLGVKPLMLALVRWLQRGHDRLEDREVRQLRAERQLKKLRRQRDDRQKALYSMLLRIRKTFDEAFGQGLAPIYLGLEAKLNDLEPLVLRRIAKEAAKILADPDFSTPEPQVLGLWENPAQYAEQIRELFEPFQTSLDEIESQKREVEKAVKAKTDLLEELRDHLTWSIRLFEAIYRLADLGFHADRLRLRVASRQKAGEKAEDQAEGSSDGEEDGGAGDEPAAPSAAPEPAPEG